MSRPSHRPPNHRDNYRPGAEDSDRSHDRRSRSRSRERRRSPPPPSRRRPESWRSPDPRDHDRVPHSRRERSVDSRRSGRPLSKSPHRPPRIEKDRARSPDMPESRHHRHSQKRRSPSPSSKRRRSVSPYPASKKSSKKSKRPRSPPPRPVSPPRRGRPREPSLSPRRVLSPRNTRKSDNRPSTRGSEKSRSPMPSTRRRSYSPRSPPRHHKHQPTSRASPPPSHPRASPRPSTRRYSPPHPLRRSPDTRRRVSPPPRKRREPPIPSSRNQSPGSPKRRRISPSPRSDLSPLKSVPASLNEPKEHRSDQKLASDIDSKRDKDHSSNNSSRKMTSLRYVKPSSPVRPKSPVQSSSKVSPRTEDVEKIDLKSSNPVSNIEKTDISSERQITPTTEIQQQELQGGQLDEEKADEGTVKSEISTNRVEIDEGLAQQSSPPSDYRPSQSFVANGPHFNADRAARLQAAPGRLGRVRPHERAMYGPASQMSSANTTPQGQGHGPGTFYQQQSQYGQNQQAQGQYQHNYRNSNPAGGFRPNQFTPVSEAGHRQNQHGFPAHGPPSQPRGRGINIFMGGRGGRGRFDQQHRHSTQVPPPPPPPPSVPPPPPPDSTEPDPNDPDDNPYRPASFRVRDELEEDETVESATPKASASKSTTEPIFAPPSEPRQMQQEALNAQMPPPHARSSGSTPHEQKKRIPTQPANDNSRGFRPFSFGLVGKSRHTPRTEATHRNKPFGTPQKPSEPPALQTSGAEATSQVVEALKAVAERERMAPPQPLQTPNTPLSATMNPNDPHRFSVYERVTMVGEGTYGKVYKAKNKNTNELVALKRIRMESERDGFPITAVREMKLLQSLKHDNIVSLLETMVERSPAKSHSDFYMVFEYMDHDLTGILNHPTFQLEPGHIKHLARQFFQGLEYLHHRGVLHRDIKASNILLDSNGLLKLADFGLARFYQKRKKGLDYTNRIITLWYRPPEILLGDTAYGPAVDIWSAGCVFAELFTRVAVFPGTTEINQLDVIYELLGTPTKADWPLLTRMPWYELLKPPSRRESKFDEKYAPKLPPAALDLVKKIFSFDPEKRPSASEVLNHAYFTSEEPEAKPCSLVHLKGDWHEFEAKSRKRKERAAAKEREAHFSRREASAQGVGSSSEIRHQ